MAAAVTALLATSAPRPGVSQQPAKSAKQPSNADSYADLASAAYRAGNYENALAQFRNAYNAAARPLFLYNMARCLEKLGRFGEAAQHMSDYLRRYRVANGRAPDNQDLVLSMIKSLREQQNARRARVVVGSNPPGAAVTRVDTGAMLGATPLKLRLKPGIYKLRLQLEGHRPLGADLVVPESGKVRAVFTMTQIVEEAALAVWVNIKRAKIEVDGQAVAISPFDGQLSVKPGRHVVRVSKAGYEPYEEIVEVPRDQLLELSYVLRPKRNSFSWRSWVGWPTLALGLGGISGGIAATVEGNRHYADSAAHDQMATYQGVGYSLGGVGLAAGLGLVLWDAIRDPQTRADAVDGRPRDAGQKLKPLRPGPPR